MPKVSICIPTYNRSKYIGTTIQSVLDSSYSNSEIIISDNASTDNTTEIVESFADERIRFYRNEHNLGPIRNWNCALQRASGEFVGLLYSDDLYGPFWLTLAVHILEKNPHIGWVNTAFHLIDEEGTVRGAIRRFARSGEIDRSEAFLRVARLDGLGPAYIVRRRILEELEYYDETIGVSADNDLYLRLAAHYPLYYSANPHHAAYRQHTDNLSHDWPITAQVAEGIAILRKTFRDRRLPIELREHQEVCYHHFYERILERVRELQARKEFTTAGDLLQILYSE
jgi:glycosyltransferase involved in cell wall biosynthesis